MTKSVEKIKQLSWGKKEKLISIGICLSLLIVVGCTLFFMRSMESRTLSADLYQVRMGVRYDFAKPNKLTRQEGLTILKSGGSEQVMMESLPLYFSNRDRMILTESMAYLDPQTRQTSKIEVYATLTQKETSIEVRRGLLPDYITGGFLYNGRDTYLFLEETTLKFLNREIVLPAFSSVIVRYRDSLEIMNYDQTEGELIHLSTGDIQAVCATYTLDLAFDKIIYEDGSSQLLLGEPSLLPSFK